MFKKFFIAVAHFFHGLTRGSEQVIIEHSYDTPEVINDNGKKPEGIEIEQVAPKPQKGVFGWGIGHNSKYQGADNYLKESEYVFSSRILRKAQSKLKERGYASVVIERPAVKSYRKQVRYVAKIAKELGVTHMFLSHFNDAGASARGCEFLIPKSSSEIDNKMADMATDAINKVFGIKERKDDGVFVVDSSHNGSGMMIALNDIGIHNTLGEPVFAGFKNKDSMAIFENEDKYVDILVDMAEACCNGTIESYNQD